MTEQKNPKPVRGSCLVCYSHKVNASGTGATNSHAPSAFMLTAVL